MSIIDSALLQAPKLDEADAITITKLARDRSGLVIGAEKKGFLELRLSRRLRQLKLRDFAAYIALLRGPDGDAEAQFLVEALATHTTAFFREKGQYEWLARHGFAELCAGGAGQSRELVIWSAACSTGAELWSAAIILDRFANAQAGKIRWSLAGSDISNRILERARQAIFSEDEIAPLDEEMRHDYLLRSRGLHSGKTLFRVAPALRAKAGFFWSNLTAPRAARPTMADVIFLRNVLIYFDNEGRQNALRNAVSALAKGGFLITGHAECLQELPDGLTAIAPSIYRKE